MNENAAGYKLTITKPQDRGDDITFVTYVRADEKHGVKRMYEQEGCAVEVTEVSAEEIQEKLGD
jgi:hypothetical protein